MPSSNVPPGVAARPVSERKRTKRGEETRSLILDATISCLGDLGYAATSVEAVMERSGLSRGSVLNQFPNRQALIAATTSCALERMFFYFYSRFGQIDDPVVRFRSICDCYWYAQTLPEGIAAIEILLAARWDKALAEELLPYEARVSAEFDRFVEMVIQSMGLPGHAGPMIRVQGRFIVFAIRGIVLEQMHHPDREIIGQARERLNEIHNLFVDRLLALR